MNKAEKRDLLLTVVKRAGGFGNLSMRIDCATAHLVAYASGIVEVPDGVLDSLRRILDQTSARTPR